jgi:hypothetical protein
VVPSLQVFFVKHPQAQGTEAKCRWCQCKRGIVGRNLIDDVFMFRSNLRRIVAKNSMKSARISELKASSCTESNLE